MIDLFYLWVDLNVMSFTCADGKVMFLCRAVKIICEATPSTITDDKKIVY